MSKNKVCLYIHLIWNTWDRKPLIPTQHERRIYRNIICQAEKMSCKVLAINGTADHIHVVLKIPSTITIAKLTKQLKGVSSHFINDKLLKDTKFKWQGGYGAFSISRWDVKK